MKVFLFFLCSIFSSTAYSQSQLSVTSFPYAIQLFNPAYVGTEDHINLSVYNKRQWLKTPGSPSMQGISGHLPFNYERLGAGLNVLKEETFALQTLYISASTSYKINFKDGRLSFGIRLGLIQRNESTNGLLVKDKNDALLSDQRQLLPEAGGGMFYKEKKFYLGLSFVRSAGIYLEQQARLKNHYYLVAGGSKMLSSNLTLMPALHIKYTGGFIPNAQLLLPVKYEDLFSIGLGYGTSSVVSAVASLNIDKVLGTASNKYLLSYSYDQSFNKRIDYIGNTHELILTLKLIPAEKVDRILKRKVTISPLFFD